MEKKRKTRGITLIALIITIIVMLILVAVTVQITINGGIFEKAGEAVGKTKAAIENESNLDIDDLVHETITGITVEQVEDENPGELETEGDENTFIINSIEDLLFFAKDVTDGNNYENKTVKLGLDLDFASNKSYVNPKSTDYEEYGYTNQEGKDLKTLLTTGEGFKPIGITTNEEGYRDKSFKGTFDGNGKIINNLYINKTLEDNKNDFRVGLFGNNYGTIENLGLNNCNISATLTTNGINTVMNGGIAGVNYKIIDSCFACGNLSTIGEESAKVCVGSLAGNCSGDAKISNCYSNTKLYATNINGNIVIGGMTGNSGQNGNIENCYSIGKIGVSCNSNDNLCWVGGVIGGSNSQNAIINNCYNISDIYFEGDFGSIVVGGVVGYFKNSNMNNCHNKGIISLNVKVSRTKVVGQIAGCNYGSGKIKDCSYLNNGTYKDVGHNDGVHAEKQIEAIEKESEMSNILDIIGEKFKEGKNGYPILSWQEE